MKIDVKLFHFPKDDKNDLNRILNLLPISMTGAIKVSMISYFQSFPSIQHLLNINRQPKI